ncbi:MAG: SpoIIE family protein phosphatase [Ardenticatenaceae bacterium]|nr:SpoIIE family protein phosphatase [Ardenticatenaceae bacterium]
MTTLRGYWRNFRGEKEVEVVETAVSPLPSTPITQISNLDLDIAPNDLLLAYVQQNPGVLDVDQLKLDSPALAAIRDAGIRLIVPLVSQGELIGLINLGSRLSEQEYSSDDYKLLADLATQAAPALRVAQLVKQQQQEAAERERIEQELKVARLIQQTLLPQDLPALNGWGVSAYYQPARAVGGDFYDFIYFPDGRIGFVVADVTDKGVPAALVMATTRTLLRAAAERLEAPGAVLARTNDVLVQEIPPKMFVTCFYAVLNPATGHLRYANAGHDVPYRYTADGVVELRATGMPLGLMPGMGYDEKEVTLAPGEYVLLYSDGLVEAHNPQREMFGFPRLQELMATHANGDTLKDFLLDQLAAFTGPGWEQEDDVTLVTLQLGERLETGDWRLAEISSLQSPISISPIEFEIPSAPGNERLAMQRVAEVVARLLPAARLEKLKTAVAEATMNAMEHGNKYDPDKPTRLKVLVEETSIRVTITDEGGGPPLKTATHPDLEAKLAGDQSPRGWGLFLIQNMVDELNVRQDAQHHTIELVMFLNES